MDRDPRADHLHRKPLTSGWTRTGSWTATVRSPISCINPIPVMRSQVRFESHHRGAPHEILPYSDRRRRHRRTAVCDRTRCGARRQTTAIREYVKGCSSARTRTGRTNNPATSIDTLFWRLSTRGRLPEFDRSTRRRIFALEGTAFHSDSVRCFRPVTGEIERLGGAAAPHRWRPTPGIAAR
jgi:hypothetical protein